MNAQTTSALYNRETAIAFYDDRYDHAYMADWPEDKKRRIREVIGEIDLPAEGTALDFGCGNGVFAEVMRRALPAWRIFGTDISRKAVANAQRRFSACTFFEAGDPRFREMRFDFVFSHHVLEHVPDLEGAIDEITEFLKPNARMLHFLPCGNRGSYEWTICSLRRDGVQTELGNRFFFEDEGHVRRLTTEELTSLFAQRGFWLHKEYYLNHYHGAIDWITRSGLDFVGTFSDPNEAINPRARLRLLGERFRLLLLASLRLDAEAVHKHLARKPKRLKHYALLLMELPLYPLSRFVDAHMKRNARREWERNRTERGGSEMCLVFAGE